MALFPCRGLFLGSVMGTYKGMNMALAILSPKILFSFAVIFILSLVLSWMQVGFLDFITSAMIVYFWTSNLKSEPLFKKVLSSLFLAPLILVGEASGDEPGSAYCGYISSFYPNWYSTFMMMHFSTMQILSMSVWSWSLILVNCF